MNFFDTVEARYSHKERFSADPVPLADLEKIAAAGLAAPNGQNKQLVKLVILPDPKYILPVCEISPTAGLETCPAAIAVFTDSSAAGEPPFDFEKEDYSAAVTQMLLAATSLGYSALWLDSPYFDAQKRAEVTAVLGAPENLRLWAVLPIGKPDGTGSRREKLPFEARVSYGKYDLPRP